MTSLEIAIMLKREFYHYFKENSDGKTKSLLQIEELIEEIMTEKLRLFVESQKRKPEILTVENFMRKTDKRNKPQVEKLNGNKLGTLKMTKEEREEAEKSLELAKRHSKKPVKLAQGFSYAFQPKNRIEKIEN